MISPRSVGRSAVAVLFSMWVPAEARSLHVRESYPVAETIVSGNSVQYVVRFDGSVDHAVSRLEILVDEKVVASLVPTVDSEPDVLAATAPVLAPGQYQLHWRARSVPDGDVSEGSIRFVVTP